MPVSFTDAFGIDKNVFDSTGAFDPILDVDSRLFIDPALLERTHEKAFIGSYEEMQHFFAGMISLLKHSSSPKDRFWRRADKELQFTEVRGTCLGYSKAGINGNGIGSQLRQQILRSIQELVQSGAEDPVLFELLGVFEEGIGADRISDLLVHKLIDRICIYTEHIMDLCCFDAPCIDYLGHLLPRSPYSSYPVLLLPKSILHPLPLAVQFEDIPAVCRENERVRECINKWFDFSEGTTPSKNVLFRHMKNDKEFRDAFIDAYRECVPIPYDFTQDYLGEISWYEKGKKLARNNPLPLESDNSLAIVVMQIVMQFKSLIEDNGAWELLYHEDRLTPRKERSAQHLFSSVAEAYCRANNIDISPEVNSGNGPVDFKFSRGHQNRMLVELKLSKNPRLSHCIEKQIPIYMRQEHTENAVYLLLNVGNDKAVAAFRAQYNALGKEEKRKIKLVVVDAKPKQSASKA